jgi:glycosyltransferase involved in cell wall biosynthesis
VWYLSKYLPTFGWEPYVITRRVQQITSVSQRITSVPGPRIGLPRDGHRALSRIVNALRRQRGLIESLKHVLHFPDSANLWIGGAALTAIRLARQNRVSVILSSAMPASTHVVGALVSHITGLPWVADFRDPWIGSRYRSIGRIRGRIEDYFERTLVDRATVITAVSPQLAASLAVRHPRTRIEVVENAFDPASWEGIPNESPAGFHLCYTGTLYGGQRSPSPFFAAVAALRAEGEPVGRCVHFDFYGADSHIAEAEARQYGVAAQVSCHGAVTRAEALRAQRRSAALLVILKNDPLTADELGSKILEYAGAGRPILAFGPKGSVVASFIAEHGLGWFASTVEECREALKAAHRVFIQDDYGAFADVAQRLPQAPEMARRFATILEQCRELHFGVGTSQPMKTNQSSF